MTTSVDDEFELSTWFNSVADKENSRSRMLASASNRDRSGDNKHDDANNPTPDPTVCYMCHMPGPEYVSSDKIRKAPPVSVCSESCEERYLESKGVRPASKKKRKQQEDEDDEVEDNGDANDEEEVDYGHCYVCDRANPDYMSTDQMKNVPSVPVCGVDCEAVYLKSKNKKRAKKTDKATPPTNVKNEPSGGEGKRSLSFLEDHLLESDDSKGYKSWWLRALTFYDFVYQRHAMWHRFVRVNRYVCGNSGPLTFVSLSRCSYTYTPEKPNVDPALTNFGR